jgi:hypothetical protein
LVSGLGEKLTRSTASRAAAVVPHIFGRIPDIVSTRKSGRELRPTDGSDIGIRGHLIHRSCGGVYYACTAAETEAGRAFVTGRDENALPLRGRLLEERIDGVVNECCTGPAEGEADTDGAALVIGDGAADIGDEIGP